MKILPVLLMTMTVSAQENPFLKIYDTPYRVPPFEQIRNEHFKPAFLEGIRAQKEEIEAVANSSARPSFDNTILAMENSGELLNKVSVVFFNLSSAHTNKEIQALAQEVAPLLARHSDDIYLNEKLFKRVKTLWDQRKELRLNHEQERLLELSYKAFVRSGANLTAADKEKLRTLNGELSVLAVKFGNNILSETNAFELVIENKEDLAGLPDDLIETASNTAKSRGKEGNWVFTLQNASIMPFLQYSAKRDLRFKIWNAYQLRGNNNNEADNKVIAVRLSNLRNEKARLLGYRNHAAFVLEQSMAGTPEKVYELLNQLWAPALANARIEEADIKKLMISEGITGEVKPHDWRYYTEKIRKQRFELDEQELKPYFALEKVREGIFTVTRKLYGLQFEQLNNVPKYHEDVTVWKVTEADGREAGLLYMDMHPRASKRGGAWMTSYRPQTRKEGKRIPPVISIVCNFTPPVSGAPALLTFDEVTTFFHEFGHALHGLLSDVSYRSMAGTAVARDFVELPSQIMENWASDPEVLKMYAKHYETGEVIPDKLIRKLEQSATFDQGFATTEYLAASLLDLDYHTQSAEITLDANAFEERSMEKIGLIGSIIPRYRTTYFQHIFAGGYSAGYYSYIWSGVLDTDAFSVFKNSELFSPEKAASFRKNILERGNTGEPMELYKRFRGSEPSITPLLKKRGLLPKS